MMPPRKILVALALTAVWGAAAFVIGPALPPWLGGFAIIALGLSLGLLLRNILRGD
jgi:uncharacterized membrane protein AbrB (regulator of aidB expression)